MLEERCPANYRKYEQGRTYLVPKISVYIPCYNAEATIIEQLTARLNKPTPTLRSLSAMTVRRMGRWTSSSLGTPLNPESVDSTSNGGIGSASKPRFADAEGCSSSIWIRRPIDATAAETLLPIIERDRSLTCVYGMCERIDHSGEFLKKGWFVPTFSRERLLHGMIVHLDGCFVGGIGRVGGFNEEMRNAVDFDFYLRLSEVGDLRAVHHLSYQYRHLTSTSNAEVKNKLPTCIEH